MNSVQNLIFSGILWGLLFMAAAGCSDSDNNTADRDSETGSTSDSNDDSDSGSTNDTGTASENDTGTDSQTESETAPDTGTDTETETNSGSESDSVTDTDSYTDSHTDFDTASDTSSDSDTRTDSDSTTDTDSTIGSDSNIDSDSDTASDTATDTTTETDTASDTDTTNPFGFTLSNPQTRTLTCDDPNNVFDGDIEEPDRHWLCTFKEGDTEGVLYVQAIPTTCVVMMSPLIKYNISVAEIYIDGDIVQLDDVGYDSGGNHKNDSLGFTFNNLKYLYNHSSYGIGYRSCQNMDCTNVSNMSDDIIETGCTCNRTRPVVCVAQAADGSFPELVDGFEVCETDPDCAG